MASNRGRRLGSLMTSFRSPTSTATSMVLQRHRDPEASPLAMTSETPGFPEEAVLGWVPTHWAQALELRRTLLKCPEPLTMGRVPQKSPFSHVSISRKPSK